MHKIIGWKPDPFDICPYSILTMPWYNRKTGVLETFSNTDHKDNNTINEYHGSVVDRHLEKVVCPNLNKYLNLVIRIFPELDMKRYPLPTICCWLLLDSCSTGSKYTHN